MSNKATPDAMNELHAAVAKLLKSRVEGEDATAADISNAIKFLKDNGIEADAHKSPDVKSLAKQFPVFDDDPDDAIALN